MAYEINYEDQKFKDVEAQKDAALSENEKLYAGMVSQSDKFYEAQADASKQWEQTQTQLQKEQTDFALEKLQQQKDQAQKDYRKEQSGAYTDWQKQSNPYGVNAEQEAAIGMSGTGYSESAQVSMYNTYQNRVAMARESFNRAVQDYNNAITEARLQNNSKLAEIAYQALQQRLELSLQGFQYKNQLLLDKASRQQELDQLYYNRWKDVLDQMNTENALAEQIRQYNTSLAEEQRQFDEQMALKTGSLAGRGGGSGDDGGSGSVKIKTTAKDYLNTAISEGATKSGVSAAIRDAMNNGTITAEEAAALRKEYVPRGYTY